MASISFAVNKGPNLAALENAKRVRHLKHLGDARMVTFLMPFYQERGWWIGMFVDDVVSTADPRIVEVYGLATWPDDIDMASDTMRTRRVCIRWDVHDRSGFVQEL